MNITSFKDAANISIKQFADCPLGKMSEEKIFDKPMSEYDKPLGSIYRNFKNYPAAQEITESETIDEKIKKQDKEIERVETGEKDLDTTQEKGNYGEMKMDQEMRKMDYERISSDMVTDLNDCGHQGIDGVYYNPDGKPQYIIADAKYGSAQLSDTQDGKQMSKNWIDKRLDSSVGKEKADEIRMETLLNPNNVGCYVIHVDEKGNTSYDKLDNNGNTVEKDVKINE